MHLTTKETERKLLHRLNRRRGVQTLLALSVYYRRHCPHKRLPLLQKASSVVPFCKDARVWFHLGEALEEEQQPYWLHNEPLPEAFGAYRRATELDPEYSDAWFAQGRLLRYRFPLPNIVELTVAVLRRAVETDPRNAAYRHWLGWILAYGPCRPDKGAKLYETGLRMVEGACGRVDWQWYELAQIYHEKLRRPKNAERAVLKALELEPEHPAYLELLAAVRAGRSIQASEET